MDRISIILAEDHVVVRQSIHRFLDREPDLCVVGEAGDGEEAVRLAAALKPDVVIMDIAMPRLMASKPPGTSKPSVRPPQSSS